MALPVLMDKREVNKERISELLKLLDLENRKINCLISSLAVSSRECRWAAR